MSISTEMFSKEVQYSFLKPAYSQRVSNTHQKAIKITPHPSAPHRDAEKKQNKTTKLNHKNHQNITTYIATFRVCHLWRSVVRETCRCPGNFSRPVPNWSSSRQRTAPNDRSVPNRLDGRPTQTDARFGGSAPSRHRHNYRPPRARRPSDSPPRAASTCDWRTARGRATPRFVARPGPIVCVCAGFDGAKRTPDSYGGAGIDTDSPSNMYRRTFRKIYDRYALNIKLFMLNK